MGPVSWREPFYHEEKIMSTSPSAGGAATPGPSLLFAMALSCLTGLAILRDVLGVRALQDDGRRAVRQLLEDVLKLCLEPAEKASDQEASQAALTQSP